MASSKLKAKSIDRATLYYNKFEYRVAIKSPHMFYSWSCKTIDQYRSRINEACNDFDKNAIKSSYWFRPRPNVEQWEYDLIESMIGLKNRYRHGVDLTFRHENQTTCVYTSNTKIVNEILKFYPDAGITHVNLMPTGVMLFKREPPAKYRAYMSNKRMPMEFKTDFIEYQSRTPDIRPSNAFYAYLHRHTSNMYPPYLWDKYYIDYDDEKNLMMMMLMFPGMIGKKYKLEQK